MKIQVNSDKTIAVDARHTRFVKGEVSRVFEQDCQNLEELFLNGNPLTLFAQLSEAQVGFKFPGTDNRFFPKGSIHGNRLEPEGLQSPPSLSPFLADRLKRSRDFR